MTVAAVIVAGGNGHRVGSDVPKQYQLIGGKPVIWWTVKAFLDHPLVSHVRCVIGADHQEMFTRATVSLKLPPPVTGGATRQDSCCIGIEACAGLHPAKILIHDAARPFVSSDLISRLITELDLYEAVIPGLPVADTMKFAPDGLISKTIDRSAMWFVQTPQAFSYDKILDAHRFAKKQSQIQLTDDAAVAENAGMEVRIIMGEQANRKLTTAADVQQADVELRRQQIIERPDIRVGQGIDFHVFEGGSAVTLFGVAIPHTHKLRGHSDADVAMHALTDAILGAIGEGDIGIHFPPSDMKWKGAASDKFLQYAIERVTARGGRIANLEVTLICERPKIGPLRDTMRERIAEITGVNVSRVAVKATTSERLGFTGREEGIAATASATIRLPWSD